MTERTSPAATVEPGVARLLPWPGEDGGPAYLPPCGGDVRLAALADEVERAQLASGAEVACCARPLIVEPEVTVRELRWTALRLLECLLDALRVAESRGARLTGKAVGRG